MRTDRISGEGRDVHIGGPSRRSCTHGEWIHEEVIIQGSGCINAGCILDAPSPSREQHVQILPYPLRYAMQSVKVNMKAELNR